MLKKKFFRIVVSAVTSVDLNDVCVQFCLCLEKNKNIEKMHKL
jgi:hypothetical protein